MRKILRREPQERSEAASAGVYFSSLLEGAAKQVFEYFFQIIAFIARTNLSDETDRLLPGLSKVSDRYVVNELGPGSRAGRPDVRIERRTVRIEEARSKQN
ncbi:hypothetical protein [Burkholderia sp. WP9]|uniref:hypothetical protein n=1 Tax=Burkholderia sp. WP9 TaxID=1500263 RepID=UPI00115FC033|nr:hypothetical protein [Burkholderia sp. WP9]